MSSLAVMGFLSGFAKTSAERIEKEREENEAFIESRLKAAATNKLVRDKEVEAQKALLKGRLSTVESISPNATYEQKLALVSSEDIYDAFKKRSVDEGVALDLNTFLTINKDKVPKNYTSVQQYIDSISAKPAPVGEEQMKALTEGEGFLGARVGPSRGAIEKRAQKYGGTASELLAYEQRTEMPKLEGFASMDVKQLRDLKPEKLESLEDMVNKADTAYAKAATEFGPQSPQAIAAKTSSSTLRTYQEELDPTKANWASTVGSLKSTMLNGTPEEKEAARKKYEEVLALEKMGKKEGEEGGKIPTANTLSTLLSRTGVKAVVDKFGGEVGKDLIIDTAQDGSTSFRYIGNKPDLRTKVLEEANRAVLRTVQPYLDPDNKPLNRDVQVALLSQGFSFGRNGEVVMPTEAAPTAAASTAPLTAAQQKAKALGLGAPTAPATVPQGQRMSPELRAILEEDAKKAGITSPRYNIQAPEGMELSPAAPPARSLVTRPTPAAAQTEDEKALAWANANPSDPRAAAIKKRLGK